MDEFYSSTRIITGTGGVSALKTLGAKRLFLVTDPYFEKNGTARFIAQASGAEAVEIWAEVQPDPTVELAARGTARVQHFAPDVIVALGGGSAMDCAKAMVYFSGIDAALVAIPTTSGSGSEVTDFAILTHDGVKHPLVDGRIRPAVAILDDELLRQLPPALVADAGFDILAHALEAYVAKNAGGITDALAKDAFCTAFACLPESFAGNTQVRLPIHLAATMAGMAFTQAGLGLCHALSHSLGGMFHIPHGRLNAILLPKVVAENARIAGSKYAAIARTAGLGGSADTVAVRNLENRLIRLRSQLALPATLAQAGVDIRRLQKETDSLIASVLADPCCQTNPIPVDSAMIRRVLEGVTGSV